jgi:hypothetical protein
MLIAQPQKLSAIGHGGNRIAKTKYRCGYKLEWLCVYTFTVNGVLGCGLLQANQTFALPVTNNRLLKWHFAPASLTGRNCELRLADEVVWNAAGVRRERNRERTYLQLNI